MPVPTESESLQAFLTDPANSIVAHLSKNDIAYDADALQLSDFVEADFAGYAPIPVTDWNVVPTDDPDYGEAVSADLEWTAGDALVPCQITGVFLTLSVNGGAQILLQPYPFSQPQPLVTPGTIFAKRVRYRSFNVPS